MKWINPSTGRASCPQCGGYGTPDDEDDTDCPTCDGQGIADEEWARSYLAARQ